MNAAFIVYIGIAASLGLIYIAAWLETSYTVLEAFNPQNANARPAAKAFALVVMPFLWPLILAALFGYVLAIGGYSAFRLIIGDETQR